MTDVTALAKTARLHADNAFADIKNASTRVQHIRATALAVEADIVAKQLETLALHTAPSAPGDLTLDFPTH